MCSIGSTRVQSTIMVETTFRNVLRTTSSRKRDFFNPSTKRWRFRRIGERLILDRKELSVENLMWIKSIDGYPDMLKLKTSPED